MDLSYSYYVPIGQTVVDSESKTYKDSPHYYCIEKTYTCSDGTIIEVIKTYEDEEIISVNIRVNDQIRKGVEIISNTITKEYTFDVNGKCKKVKYEDYDVPYYDSD